MPRCRRRTRITSRPRTELLESNVVGLRTSSARRRWFATAWQIAEFGSRYCCGARAGDHVLPRCRGEVVRDGSDFCSGWHSVPPAAGAILGGCPGGMVRCFGVGWLPQRITVSRVFRRRGGCEPRAVAGGGHALYTKEIPQPIDEAGGWRVFLHKAVPNRLSVFADSDHDAISVLSPDSKGGIVWVTFRGRR